MEQVHPARQSSGIYEFDQSSTASLGRNAAPLSGSRFAEDHDVQRTTAAGVPVNPQSGDTVPGSVDGAPTQPAAAPAPVVPWYKRRKFLISQAIIIPLGIALIFILLFPVVTAIAQLVVNRSVINIDEAAITSPQNDTFDLQLRGVVTHTGFIPATIDFTKPISVSWVQDNGSQTALGVMNLHGLKARNKRATIDDQTAFNITDPDAFGTFTETMITAENFTWRLYSEDLRVQAAKFPVSKGIKFDKYVTMKGFNSFSGNVALKELLLPSDNPEEDGGGINFATITALDNPSPFNINLGTVVFDLTYDGVDLGTGTSVNTVIIPKNNDIKLTGFLKPHVAEDELKTVSRLFTNYLNGDDSTVLAKGRSTLQSDGTVIPWLSQGLQALTLKVPFVSLEGAISPIKSIAIGDLALAFSEEEAWSPTANSNNVLAEMELPFGFNVDIGQIRNDFNISQDGTVAGLATPLGASTSSIKVLSSTKTAGTVNITIEDTKLKTDHPNFATFNANITSGKVVPFRLIGHASAVANMSIGLLTLDPIKFNVSSSLDGLQGLNGLTTIEAVDVQGGTEEGILLGINVTIENPSNLKLSTGDLTLQLHRDGVVLGTALLPNLTLNMGLNSVQASSTFKANDNAQGIQTLNDFVGQKDVQLSIVGYDGSTGIASLADAFMTLGIDVVLPGLKTSLLKQASLQVLSTTGRENNVSHVSVDLENPFSTALHITNIKSTVSSHGIPLGTIDTDTDFSTDPHSTTTSPELDLNQNLDPSAVFTLTRNLAVEAGLDVAPLDGIVDVGGIQYLQGVQSSSKIRRANLFTGFNLPSFVKTAFEKLQSDVELVTAVTIGDYSTTLSYTQSSVATQTDDSLDYLLAVLAQPIVQKIVTDSVLGIETVIISDAQQNSFKTTLKGSITDAGPFDAVISFGSGLDIVWAGKSLGNIKMDNITVVGDVGGDIEMESEFEIVDVDHLTEFTKALLTEESFEWEISGKDLVVSALGIEVDSIALTTKKVTLKGFNGLKGGVHIESFNLPSNDPDGGIHLTIEATAENPSQVGIQLSTLGFETYFDGAMIAVVASEDEVNLLPGSTSKLSLAGRLIPQDSDKGLAAVSGVFNNFIHGKDSDVVVHGASAGPSDVTWLNEGIKVLLVATSLPNMGSLDIIKSITLNQMKLLFSQDTAYAPPTSSDSTDAAFALPFAFPIDIVSLEQTITVSYNGDAFAELAIPRSPSNTDVEARIIHLTFSDVPFAVFGDKHGVFDDFLAATTMNEKQTIGLAGSANTDASTAVGILSLTGIDFNVDSTIAGLQGLNARPVTVSDLDVYQGFADYLLIKVTSALYNPSNLTIGTDDVSFNLQFQDQTIGSADIADLIIVPGNKSYPIDVHYAPQGGSPAAAGREMLQNYIQGVDSDTTIAGSTGSTPIDSLKEALSQIVLSPVTIPALHDTLIKSATLKFPLDIVDTGIASASFVLANPFTASINLLTISTTATYRGINLGTINADVSSNPVHADGHSSVTSQGLDMDFNLNPSSIIQFLSAAAAANSVNVGPLAALFRLVLENPDYHPPVKTTVDTKAPTCVSGNQFNVGGAILAALKDLRVDLDIDSALKLDDYATDLSFKQASVPAITDETALYLIGAVAGPVAQILVNQAVLAFTEANITNISNEGFDLSLVGSLTNTGPLDALIDFTEPVTVNWQGNNIAEIALEPVCAAANDGVPNYNTQARLTITDSGQFTNFATYLMHNEEFEWTISTDKLRLTALGTIFDNISLKKTVSFKAFNNLPGVTISNFGLPSDDEAGGIHVETDAVIPSPAQLGIDLGTVGFLAYYEGVLVGPLSASNLFLGANSRTQTHLSGRIVPQSGGDLDTMGVLFSDYLQGKNATLLTRGDSVQPSGSSGPVNWLSTAFKTLELSVNLPGEKHEVIQSISLSDLQVTMTDESQAYAPLTGSSGTVAVYKNPFGFSLQVFETSQHIVMASHGVDMASLELPVTPADGGVSTGNEVPLHITWEDVPLQSLNNAAFDQLFAAVTLLPVAELTLKGSADVRAHTAIGDVPFTGIEFNVESSLNGIGSFGRRAELGNAIVSGGTSEYIITDVPIQLNNPSNVSLLTTAISLPVLYDGVVLGRSEIDPYDLLPGSHNYDTEFHYMPANVNDTTAQAFITRYITTGDDIPLTIDGDRASSPYGSLQTALDGLTLGTTLPGLNQPVIITSIHVTITLETLVTDIVTIHFTVFNPLETPMQITFVQSDASIEGETYAFFAEPIEGFVIPPGATVDSGPVENVLLVKGAFASLDIIPLGYLDVATANTIIVGENGYDLPWLKLNQDRVPTTYSLELGLDAMVAKAKSISESSAEATTTSSGRSSASRSTSSGSEATSTPVPTSTASSSRPDSTSEEDAESPSAPSPTPSTDSSSDDSGSDSTADSSSDDDGLLNGLVGDSD